MLDLLSKQNKREEKRREKREEKRRRSAEKVTSITGGGRVAIVSVNLKSFVSVSYSTDCSTHAGEEEV